MSEQTKTRLRDVVNDADARRGRVDVAVYRGAKKLAKHVGIEQVWDGGLGELVETIVENVVSSKPITPQDIARELGFSGRKR